MAISVEYVVDWQNSGYFHRFALQSDPANLVGNICADIYDDVRRNVIDGTASSILNDEGLYGLSDIGWATGATLGIRSIEFFYNGSAFDYTSTVTGTVTGCIWYKTTEAGDDGLTVNIALYKNGSTLVATSANQTTSAAAGWRQLSVSGSVTAGDTVHIRINRGLTSNDTNFVFSGAMIVAGSVAPTEYNSGSASRYDNITQYVLSAGWKLGFDNPWEHLAGVGSGSLLLNNRSKIFSPEYASGALFGNLTAEKRIKIIGSEGGNDTTLYTGWIDGYTVTTSATHDAKAEIKFSDARRFLENKNIGISVVVNDTARNTAGALISAVNFPNYSMPVPVIVEAWEEIYNYTLDQNMNESEGSVLDALADTAGGANAKVFFDRLGDYNWKYQRDFCAMGISTDLTLNDEFNDAEYTYGAMVINEARVTYRRRKAGSVTTTVLWDADETITLSAGEVEVIRAMYKDPSTGDASSIGATDVTLSITAGAGVTSSIDADAQSAEITLENTSGGSRSVTVLQVLGRKLTAFRSAEKFAEDTASKALYGDQVALFDYQLPQRRAYAQQYADSMVARFAYPFGEMLSVMVAEGNYVSDADILATTIGRRIRVIDSATEHDAWYVVVGEGWQCTPGHVEATWQLERHNEYGGFRFGDALNGQFGYARFGYNYF